MASSVALLRAVNVGGRSVPMAELRTLFERLGACQVGTYIQSGNVIFHPPKGPVRQFEQSVEQALLRKHGLHSAVMVRSSDEIHDIVSAIPFPKGDDRFIHVGFFKSAPTPAEVNELSSFDAGEERVLVRDRTCYLYLPNGVGRAKLPLRLNRLTTPVTIRNLRTVTVLARLTSNTEPGHS